MACSRLFITFSSVSSMEFCSNFMMTFLTPRLEPVCCMRTRLEIMLFLSFMAVTAHFCTWCIPRLLFAFSRFVLCSNWHYPFSICFGIVLESISVFQVVAVRILTGTVPAFILQSIISMFVPSKFSCGEAFPTSITSFCSFHT